MTEKNNQPEKELKKRTVKSNIAITDLITEDFKQKLKQSKHDLNIMSISIHSEKYDELAMLWIHDKKGHLQIFSPNEDLIKMIADILEAKE